MNDPGAPEAVVRCFLEQLWNERRIDLAEQLFSPDCVTHQLKSGAPPTAVPRGPKEIRAHVAEWLAGFPDLRFTIEQCFAAGDRVVTQCVMEGTHRGQWHGVAPTGKTVSVRMLTIHRIENGRIAEDWVILESIGFFQQLGLVPSVPELIEQARRSGAASGQ